MSLAKDLYAAQLVIIDNGTTEQVEKLVIQ